jgi:hypothetical protein
MSQGLSSVPRTLRQTRPSDGYPPAGFGPEACRRRADPEQGRAVLDEAPGVGGMGRRPGASSPNFGWRSLESYFFRAASMNSCSFFTFSGPAYCAI